MTTITKKANLVAWFFATSLGVSMLGHLVYYAVYGWPSGGYEAGLEIGATTLVLVIGLIAFGMLGYLKVYPEVAE